jgi:ABC-type sugar transport system ATPase subunit
MIQVEKLNVQAGGFQLKDISFEVPDRSYAMLMGKTGCGKTTLLEVICGLRKVTDGKILLGGVDVTYFRPGQRGIGFVPQDVALFKNMTVYEHLAFGPIIRKWPKKTIREQAEHLAEELGISHLLKRKPAGLSGGERQRVALGRALSTRPKILCLDEPLSALDDSTHSEICELILSIRKEYPFTAFHITHSRHEAERLADLTLRMEDGRLVE